MNCLTCGNYIDIQCSSLATELQLRFCGRECKLNYTPGEVDKDKIYEISNIELAVE